MDRVSKLCHSEYDFSISFNVQVHFTILGQAKFQVLFRHSKLGSCKLLLSVVCWQDEFDIIYLTKNSTMWKYKNFRVFCLLSDPLPVSSVEDSGQPIIRVRGFSCSGLGTSTATSQPVISTLSSSSSFPTAVFLIKHGSECYLPKRKRRLILQNLGKKVLCIEWGLLKSV